MKLLREWRGKVYRTMDEASSFFASDEWLKLRTACYKRDGYQCQVNGCQITGAANLAAHHIIPRDEGGADALYNLISLCNKHHDKIEEQWHEYSTRALIEAYNVTVEIEEELSANIQECPEHPGVICWHMAVYGGMSRRMIGEPLSSLTCREGR